MMKIFLWRRLAFKVLLLSLSGCGCSNSCDQSKNEYRNLYDCGCTHWDRNNSTAPASGATDYYIISRYACNDGSDCQVETHGISCSDARDKETATLARVGDFCHNCSGNIYVGRYWNNSKTEVQGGPCQSRNIQPPKYYSSRVLTLKAGLAHVLRAQLTPPPNNDADACEKLCEEGSPYCLRLDLGGTERAGLKQMEAAIRTGRHRIATADMLSWFGQRDNSCRRNDTALENNHLSNTSADGFCIITTSIGESTMQIQVPGVLYGRWALSGNNGRANFDDPKTSAKLFFSDETMNSDWGGDIKAAYSSGNYMGLSVGTQSCIRAVFD